MPRNVTENSGPAETTILSKHASANHIKVVLDGSATEISKIWNTADISMQYEKV